MLRWIIPATNATKGTRKSNEHNSPLCPFVHFVANDDYPATRENINPDGREIADYT